MASRRDRSPHGVKSVKQLTDKGLRTKAALVAAARAVFERDGFVDARVADIVGDANVAHGTFYLYFSSKEDVLKAVVLANQDAIDGAARDQSGPHDATAHHAIEAANRSYIESWARHHRLMQAWSIAAGIHPDIAKLLDEQIERNIARNERALRRMQAAGRVAADIDPGYTARALTSMVMQFCIHTFRHGPDGVDVAKAVQTVTDLWCRGIQLDDTAARR